MPKLRSPTVEHSNVYIGNLPAGIETDDFKRHIAERYRDSIESSWYDPYKGHGFLKFTTIGAAREAVSHLNGSRIGGRYITVKAAYNNYQTRACAPPSERIYVWGLQVTVTDQHLRTWFCAYGCARCVNLHPAKTLRTVWWFRGTNASAHVSQAEA